MTKALLIGPVFCAAVFAFAGNAAAHTGAVHATKPAHVLPSTPSAKDNPVYVDCATPALASCMSSQYDGRDGKPKG
jgi:hypothetical protein